VPPCDPTGHRDISSARAPMAANGNPEAMPFAIMTTSGSTL